MVYNCFKLIFIAWSISVSNWSIFTLIWTFNHLISLLKLRRQFFILFYPFTVLFKKIKNIWQWAVLFNGKISKYDVKAIIDVKCFSALPVLPSVYYLEAQLSQWIWILYFLLEYNIILQYFIDTLKFNISLNSSLETRTCS